jgi:hypothetical protein
MKAGHVGKGALNNEEGETTEYLLLKEAARDLEAESRGVPIPIGEMQRTRPNEYKAARELAMTFVNFAAQAALSMDQAKKISLLIHSKDEGLSSIQDVLNMQPVNALTLMHLVRLERKHTAKKSADAKHDKPGGSRDKKAEIRKIWASEKYDNRDLCAEEEHGAVGVSLSTARKYLRGTPNPPSRS